MIRVPLLRRFLGRVQPLDDQGGLTMSIDRDRHGNVRIEFVQPVSFFTMPPRQAVQFAKLIIMQATGLKL